MNNIIKLYFFNRDFNKFFDAKKLNLVGSNFKYIKTKHSWHLVDPSPWPLTAALGAFMATSGGVYTCIII